MWGEKQLKNWHPLKKSPASCAHKDFSTVAEKYAFIMENAVEV